MHLNLPASRFDDRRALLSMLDNWQRQLGTSDALTGLDGFQTQAFDALHRGVVDAFRLQLDGVALRDTTARFTLYSSNPDPEPFRLANISNKVGRA